MTLLTSQIRLEAGVYCFDKYGVACRRTDTYRRGGESVKETLTRASVATREDINGLVQACAVDTLRRTWLDTDADGDRDIAVILLESSPATNIALHSRDLTITHQLTVTGGAGIFTDGETVTATGGGTGTYVLANSTATLFSIRGGSGTFTGTLTGGSSAATKTISSVATVWVRTTMSAARTQTGADGIANKATLLTATAGNATLLQAITLASSSRRGSAYVKRITGSGTVEMTTNGGSTWVALTLSAATYIRLPITAATVTNPSVGFRIVTNGDAIAVDYFQNETGPDVSSAIETLTVAVTRAADLCSLPDYLCPDVPTAVYHKHVELLTPNFASSARLWIKGDNANTKPQMYMARVSAGDRYAFTQAAAASSASITAPDVDPVLYSVVETLGLYDPDALTLTAYTAIGGAEPAAPTSIACPSGTPASAYSETALHVSQASSWGNQGWIATIVAEFLSGSPPTMADFRARL